MMEIKILGIVLALPPLSSPSSLLRWFLAWRTVQILAPAFLRYEEAVRKATDAFKGFAQAMKDADMEEDG